MKAVIDCELGGLFGKASGVARLRTEENVQRAVACKHGVQRIGDTGSWGDSSHGFCCFDGSGCGFNHFLNCAVADQFVLDDFNRTGFGGLDDDVAKFGAESTHERGAAHVSVEHTVGAYGGQNHGRIVRDFEHFGADVLTRIAGDAILVNPYFCDHCHGKTSCSRFVGIPCQP